MTNVHKFKNRKKSILAYPTTQCDSLRRVLSTILDCGGEGHDSPNVRVELTIITSKQGPNVILTRIVFLHVIIYK